MPRTRIVIPRIVRSGTGGKTFAQKTAVEKKEEKKETKECEIEMSLFPMITLIKKRLHLVLACGAGVAARGTRAEGVVAPGAAAAGRSAGARRERARRTSRARRRPRSPCILATAARRAG